jgi:hypothetical protein
LTCVANMFTKFAAKANAKSIITQCVKKVWTDYDYKIGDKVFVQKYVIPCGSEIQ